MFSVGQLLIPINDDQACGEDIAFSAEVDAIARARIFDDPTLDQGEWVVALKEADWPFVAARCAKLIESRSKDLRLAVWLAEAQAKTRQFRGLGDGYAVLAGLCEHFWDGLYPLAEEGEYEQRIGNLGWLLARTPQLVKAVPLTEEGGYSWSDFELARQRAGAAEQPQWGAAPSDGADTLARLESARSSNTPAFDDALLADARYCLATLGELERLVDARLGADGPGFSAARDALNGAIHLLAPRASADAEVAVKPMAAGVGVTGASGDAAGQHPGSYAGAIRGRQQALDQLRLVADFFRRTEPHSPVAYLADKAASWGELPLHLWLRAVVKDPAAIAQLDELLGSSSGPV